jgi:HEXXH motif-containing protein
MIRQHVAAALEAPGLAWFPGLATELRRQFWTEEQRLPPDRYSTAAWLSGGGDAGRPLSRIRLSPEWITVEGANAAVVARLRENGLVPASDGFALGVAPALREGAELLMRLPSLAAAAGLLVRSVHVLTPAGPGYDVSHSDPALPFSIFLTVPAGESQVSWRVAESLVHEAMHLQLSLIERWCPLIDEDRTGSGYSPWQRRQRPLGGLLHGLYVFRVIDQMYDAAQSVLVLAPGEMAYVARRRREIAEEISTVAPLADNPGLTEAGRRLVRRLLLEEEAPVSDRGSLASSR